MSQDATYFKFSISHDEIELQRTIADHIGQELLESFDDDEGEAAAEQLCELYFTESVWDEQFGRLMGSNSVVIEIHEPERLAGAYDVQLERVVMAVSTRRDG